MITSDDILNELVSRSIITLSQIENLKNHLENNVFMLQELLKNTFNYPEEKDKTGLNTLSNMLIQGLNIPASIIASYIRSCNSSMNEQERIIITLYTLSTILSLEELISFADALTIRVGFSEPPETELAEDSYLSSEASALPKANNTQSDLQPLLDGF